MHANPGFDKPCALQQRAIVPMLSGQDTVAQTQSGIGKTAALGVLGRVDGLAGAETQGLILVTRPELTGLYRGCNLL